MTSAEVPIAYMNVRRHFRSSPERTKTLNFQLFFFLNIFLSFFDRHALVNATYVISFKNRSRHTQESNFRAPTSEARLPVA